MDIRISKECEVPLRKQLAEQIVLLIATAKLKPAQELPSVRELARRLKIHHNTVSEAYQDLVKRNWLVRRRGAHLVVRSPQTPPRPEDLDDLINPVIELARERGYSLQALRERVRERLLAQPPDHVLVVEQEEGLRRLLAEEIGTVLKCPVEVCSRDELAAQPGFAIGALVVTPRYAQSDVKPLVPKSRPPIAVTFCPADAHVERIRKLRQPSVIAVVSISQAFLTAARSLLAPALGRVHTLAEHLLPLENPRVLKVADLVFCDSVALKIVKTPAPIHYKLLAPESAEYLANAVKFGT
jgi:DNA-binding transcriptional regulator YhcF (GntR family)